jgi:HSP20 family protein
MLTRRNPWDIIWRNDLTDFFDDFTGKVKVQWRPVSDVYEDEEKITVEVELPGIDPKDVVITTELNCLTIKGEMPDIYKEKKSFFRAERLRGSFTRSFSLPLSVESEKILATYNKGVLTITIPKRPETVPRKVDIKVLE